MSYNKETGMYEGYIYKIYNDVNDKVYVGQTIKTIKERWKCHVCDAKNNNDNMIIHKAMNKYGIDNFKYIEIEKITKSSLLELKEDLNKMEIYYISKLNTVRPYGYNISIGGGIIETSRVEIDQYDLNCNYINSFDSIAEASEYTGIPRASIDKCVSENDISNKSAYGYVFVKKGRSPYQVNETTRPVNQFDLKGNFICSYNSIKDASKATNIDSSNIIFCCKKQKYKSAGGYIWRYKDEAFTKEEIDSLNNNTYILRESIYPSIKQFDVFGNYIDTYKNVSIASQSTNTTQGSIISTCLGKTYSANKYVWRFIDDDFDKYNINYEKNLSKIFPMINMYSTNDEFIKQFNSPSDACIFLNAKSISAICNCCNYLSKTSYGYKWFWIFDEKQPSKDAIIHKHELYDYVFNKLEKGGRDG